MVSHNPRLKEETCVLNFGQFQSLKIRIMLSKGPNAQSETVLGDDFVSQHLKTDHFNFKEIPNMWF